VCITNLKCQQGVVVRSFFFCFEKTKWVAHCFDRVCLIVEKEMPRRTYAKTRRIGMCPHRKRIKNCWASCMMNSTFADPVIDVVLPLLGNDALPRSADKGKKDRKAHHVVVRAKVPGTATIKS
jgi:hypothetical protein